ncbi:Single-stranded DNA binding protein [Natranaeroarchaeum aerophilus]|uniref:Single-stranded DNA binding protein n=1 Tax=Natranaeroarchaeum aerophilus TaxID=2917711 RepID=A0AAE3FPZ9_9EURY|nr:Single-stranded DNA binding protein [Natranaeroarchaeum aerophilus]MCL9812990.1 Single-stranded DNA binding protein [Natranaeroarchaeum aerophilus]
MTVEERAEELASDLGVDKEEVTEDLENLVAYSVPIDEAVQSLRRKYGGTSDSTGTHSIESIDEITTADGSVTVTARVLSVGKRSIRYQGDDQTIFEGTLADESGRIDYTAWQDFGLSAGDTLTIGNAGVREWDGKPELNLGEGTSVAVEEDPLDVPYEIGGDADLVDIETGDRGVNVEVQVAEVERRTIDGRDGETDILSGVLADETGQLPFTDWDPHPDLETEGNSVRVENAYVREYRGVPSINVSEFSTVTALDRTVEVSDTGTRLAIGEAVDAGGVYDVEVTGHVLSVREGSGLIQRCPECDRVVQNGQCRTHGEVDAYDDLRVKAIVDDGTGTLTAVLDAEITEEIYGGGLEDAREQAREAMDQTVVADSIREGIVGREFRIRGHLSVDEYGANLDASEFAEVDDEPKSRATALLTEVRG